MDFVCFVVAWLIQQPRIRVPENLRKRRKLSSIVVGREHEEASLENESLNALFEHLNVEIDEKPNSDIGKLHVRQDLRFVDL